MGNFATLEVNSTFMKLTIAKQVNDIYFTVLDEIVDYVDICEDMARSNEGDLFKNRPFLIRSTAGEVIKTRLYDYKKLYTSYDIREDNLNIIISNCVGQAKNIQSFIAVFKEVFTVEATILNDEEELFALYSGVFNSLDVPKGLIIDVSMHHTNLILFARRNIILQKTIYVGAESVLRLYEAEKDTKKRVTFAYDYFKNLVSDIDEIKNMDPETLIISTGLAGEVATIVSQNQRKYSYLEKHSYQYTTKNLADSLTFLQGLEVDPNKKLRGISEERSDCIPLAVAGLKAICDSTNITEIINSTHGLCYYYLLNKVNPITKDKPMNDILGYNLDAQYAIYEESRVNSNTVYELSMMLFKELKVVHKLPRMYVRPLRIASYMYAAGRRINFYNNSRHAYNVILSGGILGATHKEIIIAAFIASAVVPTNLSLVEFAKFREVLTEEDLDAVKKLGCLVRIAKELDRCSANAVSDLNCDILGDSIVLKVGVKEDASFEVKEAKGIATEFYRAFKRNIEIL